MILLKHLNRLGRKQTALLATGILVLSVPCFLSSQGLALDSKQELTIELPPPSTNERAPTRAPTVGAKSAILVDAASGQILFERDARRRRPMASTTKIMTAVLFLEHCKNLKEMVTASKKAACTDNSSLHLKVGERITARNLLYGMLVRSANDGSVAAAEHVSGSCAAFVQSMNKKAKSLGALDTHFVNPHGLHDPNHYSTAYDLSLLARRAIEFGAFNEVVRTRKATIERSKNKKDLVLFNYSKFLKRYARADGIKSGYTKQAGRCYVGSATKDGWRLVSVALASPNVADDTIALMDYGFNNFKPVIVARRGEVVGSAAVKGGAAATVPVTAESELHAIVKPGEERKVTSRLDAAEAQAPVRRGDRMGTMFAHVDGKQVAAVPIRADADVGVSLVGIAFPWLRNGFILLIGIMVSRKYGAATAKSSGRRRRRVSQEVRGVDRRR